jgi:hypothetical protein
LWSKIGLGAVGVVGMMTSAVHLSLAAYEKMSAEQPINPNGLIQANDNHTYSVVKQVDNGLTFYACRNESDRFKPVINCATGGTNSPWNTNQPASLFTGDLITSDHVGNATVVVS